MISGNFKDKIIRTFGVDGEKWLIELPQLIDYCKEKWNLTNLSSVNDLSYNFVCFAVSHEFGDVALKIGVHNKELYSEIEALTLYDGKDICKLYDYDIKFGALLLQRISPGNNLTSIKDNSKRFKIASELIYNLSIPVSNIQNIPKYSDWIERALSYIEKENNKKQKIVELISTWEKYYYEIESLGIEKALLHGDLHHYNILKDKNEKWKIIDPKGVIGIPYIECARFIENQLSMVKEEDKLINLEEMITVFSNKFKVSKLLILKCLFLDIVLSTIWLFEDNEKYEDIEKSIKNCYFILEYLNKVMQE